MSEMITRPPKGEKEFYKRLHIQHLCPKRVILQAALSPMLLVLSILAGGKVICHGRLINGYIQNPCLHYGWIWYGFCQFVFYWAVDCEFGKLFQHLHKTSIKSLLLSMFSSLSIQTILHFKLCHVVFNNHATTSPLVSYLPTIVSSLIERRRWSPV